MEEGEVGVEEDDPFVCSWRRSCLLLSELRRYTEGRRRMRVDVRVKGVVMMSDEGEGEANRWCGRSN